MLDYEMKMKVWKNSGIRGGVCYSKTGVYTNPYTTISRLLARLHACVCERALYQLGVLALIEDYECLHGRAILRTLSVEELAALVGPRGPDRDVAD